METECLLQVVGASIALLIAGILYFLYYLGYFYKVRVTTGRPIISEAKVAYKFHQGNYNACGPFFDEIVKICPDLKCIAVYHDNPDVVDPNKCRYVVGVIIAEGRSAKPDETLFKTLEKKGFKFTTFPEIELCVKSAHPFTISWPSWSAYIAGYKVYTKLIGYILENKLTAHPKLEIYEDQVIHYMAPLSKYDEFYVDEVKYILKDQE